MPQELILIDITSNWISARMITKSLKYIKNTSVNLISDKNPENLDVERHLLAVDHMNNWMSLRIRYNIKKLQKLTYIYHMLMFLVNM